MEKQQVSRLAKWIGCGVLAALALCSASAWAQPKVFNPAETDVAGVKLGMTPDEAQAALHDFNDGFAIEKRYIISEPYGFTEEGTTLEQISQQWNGNNLPRDKAIFTSLIASQGKGEAVCSGGVSGMIMGQGCSMTYSDDVESVSVWFSLVPGQQRVIAVLRTKGFHKDPHPTLAALKTGLTEKYPLGQVSAESASNYSYTADWIFDSKGQLLSKRSFASRGLTAWQGRLPSSASHGDGKGLGVRIDTNGQNNSIADSLSMALYDAGALYDSIGQGKAAYQAIKKSHDAEEVEHSESGARKTKF